MGSSMFCSAQALRIAIRQMSSEEDYVHHEHQECIITQSDADVIRNSFPNISWGLPISLTRSDDGCVDEDLDVVFSPATEYVDALAFKKDLASDRNLTEAPSQDSVINRFRACSI